MLKDNDIKKYHIGCSEGDIGKYCILPGDPGRCAHIAQHFDDAYRRAAGKCLVYHGYAVLRDPHFCRASQMVCYPSGAGLVHGFNTDIGAGTGYILHKVSRGTAR